MSFSSNQKYGLQLRTCSEAANVFGDPYDYYISMLDRSAALRLDPFDEDEDANLSNVISVSKGHAVAEWRDVYDRVQQCPCHTIPHIPVRCSAPSYAQLRLLRFTFIQ